MWPDELVRVCNPASKNTRSPLNLIEIASEFIHSLDDKVVINRDPKEPLLPTSNKPF